MNSKINILIIFVLFIKQSNCFLPYTISDEACKSECMLYNNKYYFCYTKSSWDYCSPMNNLDYYGNECKTDHKCNYYGENYQWCYLKKGGWEYCSIGDQNQQHKSISSRGFYCKNECRKYGSDYYWCDTVADGWDYCSPFEQVDYHGNECKQNHKCDYYGEDYAWCYLKKGSWGYCTYNPYEEDRSISTHGYYCQNECNNKRSYKYYWCNTIKGSHYCSPSRKIDYYGNECRDDHKCDFYGEKYSWCYLKKGSWGYCSNPKTIKWDSKFEIVSCSIAPGRAVYKSFLHNYPKSMTVEKICSSIPINVPRQGQIYAQNCHILGGLIIGKFEANFDRSLDKKNSDLDCTSTVCPDGYVGQNCDIGKIK